MPHAKRWLFLAHRWLGVLLCAFFAMWFVSGVVMMYVGYPKLTPAERLRHLPPLPATGLLEPAQALRAAGLDGPLQALRLAAASGGHAVYLAAPAPAHGPARTVVIDAATGERLAHASAARALASALAFQAQMPPGAAALEPPQYLGEIGEDAFTLSRALDAHRPLHKLQLHDAAATVLYVSSQTGEVVRDAPRRERAWNYLGAWIHWLYPLRGGVLDAWWAGIVDGLALMGIALALTGTVAGVWRWRFAGRYRSGARTPYPGAVMRWHHVAGLLFALSTGTWIFSGLMSMNPWKIFDSGAPALRTTALHGGPLQLAEGAARVQALLQAAGPGVRELRWTRTPVSRQRSDVEGCAQPSDCSARRSAQPMPSAWASDATQRGNARASADRHMTVDATLGDTVVQAHGASGPPRLLDAATARPATIDATRLRAQAARLVDAPLARLETLQAYDLYYYDRAEHTMTGGGEKPLPVLRAVFGDAHGTWVHIDPATGAVLGRLDSHRRASRWLFGLLHSWDWLPLLQRRPAWDALLIALSLGGAALSLTGVVIGWRRLARKLRAASGDNRGLCPTARGRPRRAPEPLPCPSSTKPAAAAPSPSSPTPTRARPR